MSPKKQKLPDDFRLAILAEKAVKLYIKTDKRRHLDRAIMFYDKAKAVSSKVGDADSFKIFRSRSSILSDIRKEAGK